MTKLKFRRQKLGLSQAQLAQKTGINIRTLQCYEQGAKSIDHAKLNTILKLSIVLKCDMSEILENSDVLNLYHKNIKSKE